MFSIKVSAFRFLTGRLFISFLNIIFTLLAVRIFIASLPLLFAYNLDKSEVIEELLDGIDNILVSYGVILEERGFLMNFLKLYPTFSNRREKLTDHVCEAYGIGFLILGLLMELPDKQISVPDDILNTNGLEVTLYSIAVILILVTIFLFLKFTYELVKLEFSSRKSLEIHRSEEE